jgi:hypothetical protein
MGNSRVTAAKAATSTAQSTGSDFASKSNDIGSTLVPQLTQEATHPQGYNPNDLNSMLVAGEQGAGGATSGVTGQANLEAARTHNTGALSGVLDQAARQKQQQLSQNALDVQGKNADLKQRQQQAGLAGLQGIYGTDVNANLKAQGLVPEDIGAWTQAHETGPLQDAEGIVGTVANAASKFKPIPS